jgi:ribosomal protein RSM22 (predicted rRNA methylase)
VSPLRILDVGAGLGATTWGVVRALEAAGWSGVVEATWLDVDPHALDVAAEVVRERARVFATNRDQRPPEHGRIDLRVSTRVRPVGAKGALDDLGRFDVVLVSQLLSELEVGAPADRRIERHAALLGDLLERHVADRGALVVIEPALRDRTRHLHHVRDSLAAIGVTIFAPCTHALSCPALTRESDWCHEDVPVDLPPWLVPVARAAGLRHQGLTFSYLVLRNDRARLADLVAGPPAAPRLRVVSDPIPSKGKHEAFVCGEFARPPPDAFARSEHLRTMRLDRDATDLNSAWTQLRRGDVLVVDPPLSLEHARIGLATQISRGIDPRRSHA